jgi:uncharacterized repeat protein (TIGR03803 family)
MYPKVFVRRLCHATRLKLHFILAACVAMWVVGAAQAQTFEVLYSFQGPPDGRAPDSKVILDTSGTLYGVTYGGGTSYEGTAYSLTSSGKEKVLYSFCAGYGNGPNSVIQAADGTLYGTTSYGGSYGEGEVFQVNQKGDETVQYSFSGTSRSAGGVTPTGVIRDEQGTLYGTTTNGGSSSGCFGYGCGMVFKLDPKGNFSLVYTFSGGQDGGYPSGSIVRDAAGNIYGATGYGGDLTCFAPYGCGVVFKINPEGKETVLHTFTGKNGDGAQAWSGVVSDKDNNLYGSNVDGGTGPNCNSDENGCGTVYKIDTSGKRRSFTASPELEPIGHRFMQA